MCNEKRSESASFMAMPQSKRRVLWAVSAERETQDAKWGGAAHDDAHTGAEFAQLIQDYAGWARTMSGMGSVDKERKRLVQVAALAVARIEAIDRLDR